MELQVPKPQVLAIDMGYGHLRPAAALADFLRVDVLQMDCAPAGSDEDARFWARTRKLYEPLTRFSQLPLVGPPMQALLSALTAIPEPWPRRNFSGPTQGTRWMERAAQGGIGRQLAESLKVSGAPLLSTFYAGAILAELHGATNLHCLITDSDINRVWAPPDAARSDIHYFAPGERARRRMESYGVRPSRIRVTGFPLPHELVGGRERTALKRNLAGRMVRLDPHGAFRSGKLDELERRLGPLPLPISGDPQPPLLTFAVGGAGAQMALACELVSGVRQELLDGRLRLALVAGRRHEVAEGLREAVSDAGIEAQTEILEDPDVFGYFRKFNALLARTDVLWSKPSELTFFAALGLPLVCAPPVGIHESRNRRWAVESGAGLQQHAPATAGAWLCEWIEDGILANAAWNGFNMLPSLGLYEIADAITSARPTGI